MGRQEVEVVRRMCDAFARGDWASGAESLHEDIEWDTTTMGVWPEAEVLRGREAVPRFFADFLGTWEEYHAEFEEFVDAGEHVIALIHDGGRGKGSGVEVEPPSSRGDPTFGSTKPIRSERIRRHRKKV